MIWLSVIACAIGVVLALYTICDICFCAGWKLGWAKLFSVLFIETFFIFVPNNVKISDSSNRTEFIFRLALLFIMAFCASNVTEGFYKTLTKKWSK